MWHTNQTPRHCSSLEDLSSLLNRSPCTPALPVVCLFILVLEGFRISLGINEGGWGGWQRPAFPVYKLLVANSSTFQTGMLVAPPTFLPQRLKSIPGKGSMPRGAEQGSWKHHAGFGQAYLRKAGCPRPGVAGSFWLLVVKSQCATSIPAEVSSAEEDSPPFNRTISQASEAPEIRKTARLPELGLVGNHLDTVQFIMQISRWTWTEGVKNTNNVQG